MNKIIGIDLGTTNSCVAVMEGNTPVVIPNREGDRTTPSMISFVEGDTSKRKIGMAAKRQAVTNAKKTFYSVKRLIGKPYDSVKNVIDEMPYDVEANNKGMCAIRVGNQIYSTQELSAMILQELKATATDYLGQDAQKAVITVPAYFNDQERLATKEAGQIAGLEVVRIINEPTAAALAFGFGKEKQNLKVAVYDLGGGTFDISILECEGGVFEVKSTNGDVNLGGDNFDARVVDWVLKEFEKKESISLRKESAALQRIREAVEKAKKELSSTLKTEIILPYITATNEGPKHLQIELSRSKFEQLCDDLIQKTLEPCRKALQDSGFSVEQIDQVILVGGSTRIPKIQDEVKKFFKKDPCKGVNPDEVVAIGAAIQGSVLAGETKGVVLLDVTPLSLGIETLGGICTKLIEANTTIPTKRSQIFSTAQDNQPSVTITVLQGERPLAKDNKILGQFHLENIPPAPKGQPKIEVTFDIDANGIVCVSAKDQDTGREKDIRIEGSSSLSKEEIEKMKKEAALYAESDKKEKEKIDKLNNADAIMFQMEKSLKEHGGKFPEEKKKKMEAVLAELKKARASKDVEKTDSLLKENEALFGEFMQYIANLRKAKEETKTKEQSESTKAKDVEFEDVKKD